MADRSMLHAPLHAAMLLMAVVAVNGCGQLGFDELDTSELPDARNAPRGDAALDSALVDAPPTVDAPLADAQPDAPPATDGGPLVPDAALADAGRDAGGLCEFDTDCTRCERCMPDGSCVAEDFTDLTLGHQTTCAIGAGGSRWCTGRNESGELGLPTLENRALFTRNVDEEGWQAIEVGYGGSGGIGIRNDALWRWGVGADTRPSELEATQTWTQVDIAQGQFCAIDDAAGLRCSIHMPTVDLAWATITVGYRGHLCGISPIGALFCWGPDENGKLGLGVSVPMIYPNPQPVGVDTDWLDVGAGEEHTCALRTNGTLWCWGLPARLGLGAGAPADGLPHQVGLDTDWEKLAVGWRFTCAVKVDGTAWCWGDNGHGQLGTGDMSSRDTPTEVTVPRVSRIWAGGHHTCVQTTSDLECWGRNTEGELNQGDFMNRLTPTHICP